MKIERSGREIRTIDEWMAYAPPKSIDHWQPGRSAFECANAWCGSGIPAMPREILELLNSHPDTSGPTVVSAIPEHQVRFDKLRGEPRNTDLAVLATGKQGKLAISIEAKSDESFGDYVGDMLADALDRNTHGERTEVAQRIGSLLSLLPARVPRSEKAGTIRYQLLTALAGTLTYARENESAAVLVIHEFHTSRTDPELLRSNQIDLERFMRRLSSGQIRDVPSGTMLGPFLVGGLGEGEAPTPVYVGKATRSVPALSSRGHR